MIIHFERTFDSAHFVQSDKGKCRRLHGHTWKVEVWIKGEIQSDGMIINFNDVDLLSVEC